MFSISDLFYVSSLFEQFLVVSISLLVLLIFGWIVQKIMQYRTIEKEAFALVQKNFESYLPAQKSTIQTHYQQLIKGCEPSSLIAQQINYLFHIVAQQQSIHIPSLLQLIPTKEKNHWTTYFAKSSHKLFLLIGGIGVIYGSLNFLDNLRLSDLGTLFTGETTAFRQISGAFIPLETGLFIFFWSLLAALLVKTGTIILTWQQSSLHQKIAEFTSQHLIPLFIPVKEEVKFAELIQQVSNNTQSINTIVTKLHKTANQLTKDYDQIHTFTQTFQQTVNTYTATQKLWHKDIAALTDLIAGYKERLESSAVDNLRIIEALQIHNKTMTTLNQKLYDTEFNVTDWLQEIIALSKQQQADFKQSLKSILDLTRGNLSTIQSISNRFGNSIRKFDGSLKNLEGVLKHYDTTMQELSQHELKRLSEVSTKLTQANTYLENIKTNFPNHLQQLIQILENTNQVSDPEFIEKIATTIADYRIKERIQVYEENKKEEALALEIEKRGKKRGFVQYLKGRLLD